MANGIRYWATGANRAIPDVVVIVHEVNTPRRITAMNRFTASASLDEINREIEQLENYLNEKIDEERLLKRYDIIIIS